jgi:hypothetical protein
VVVQLEGPFGEASSGDRRRPRALQRGWRPAVPSLKNMPKRSLSCAHRRVTSLPAGALSSPNTAFHERFFSQREMPLFCDATFLTLASQGREVVGDEEHDHLVVPVVAPRQPRPDDAAHHRACRGGDSCIPGA